MDVAAEVERIIDRGVEQDDFDENALWVLNDIVEKIKDPTNLEAVNPRSVDREKVKKKTQAMNQMLSRIHAESITEINLLMLVGANAVAESVGKKEKLT